MSIEYATASTLTKPYFFLYNQIFQSQENGNKRVNKDRIFIQENYVRIKLVEKRKRYHLCFGGL